MNILFVRLSYIGDILHATPAARWIKEHYPAAKLHWIVTPSMVDLLKGNPYVDDIIPWERDEYEAHSKKLHISMMWRMWWELRAKLKPYKFDVAVDVQGRLITGLVLLASGAPIRLGLGGTKELNWLFTNYKAKPSIDHVIKRYIEVAELLDTAVAEHSDLNTSTVASVDNVKPCIVNGPTGKKIYHMDFFIPSNVSNWAEEQWSLVNYDSSLNRGEVDKPLRLGLVLGTSWTTKEWPQEKWYSLIKSLRYRANFVCLGGAKEADQYKPLMDSLADEGFDKIMLNMLGKTTLQEVGALIESCDVVVTADTGSLHIALALNKPVVALFGPTDPKLWGPLTGNFKILVNDELDCLGCRKRRCPKSDQYCMSGIDSVRVKKAIFELIGDKNGKV
ncbi:MAG: glycosyltransferase family 9 protein [Veillonella sp.]|uniref:glycosyltransferase family 9 protein n=1 Tax=Veillonella sp. TaxID=1926307 RepID=UPI0025E478B4|nr:glycosyltransferase family 9 protein [Veillonella sp.]MBS5336618.1 glycosyltransferase family 9 protein [Veillonella sp.]